ncbi:MAG: 6-carboxytetrahydropterin synthase QueD [Rhodothermales bacterium]
MRVAKRFRWEGAHRLPWHTGGCQHLHGHSYVMFVEVDGEPDAQGMLIDFKAIKQIVKPLVEQWDHATFVAEDDAPLRQAMATLGSKHYVLPYDSTSENLCRYVLDHMAREGAEVLQAHGVRSIRVRLQETETCYAEDTRVL